MIGPDVIDEIAAVLGVGDMLGRRRSRRADRGSLILEGQDGVIYVVDVQRGPTDDRQIVRLVEGWAAARRRCCGRRCYAVLAAERIEPRYANVLRVIGGAVPLVAIETSEDVGRVKLRLALRLR